MNRPYRVVHAAENQYRVVATVPTKNLDTRCSLERGVSKTVLR